MKVANGNPFTRGHSEEGTTALPTLSSLGYMFLPIAFDSSNYIKRNEVLGNLFQPRQWGENSICLSIFSLQWFMKQASWT